MLQKQLHKHRRWKLAGGVGGIGGSDGHIGDAIGIPAPPAFLHAKTISVNDEIEFDAQHRLNRVANEDDIDDKDDVTCDALEIANTANFETLRMTQSSAAIVL